MTVTNHSVSNASEISFSLPTDRRTKVTISLTNKDGVKLLFQNITISKLSVVLILFLSTCRLLDRTVFVLMQSVNCLYL